MLRRSKDASIPGDVSEQLRVAGLACEAHKDVPFETNRPLECRAPGMSRSFSRPFSQTENRPSCSVTLLN